MNCDRIPISWLRHFKTKIQQLIESNKTCRRTAIYFQFLTQGFDISKNNVFYSNYWLPLCEEYNNFSWRCIRTSKRTCSSCIYILLVFIFYQAHFAPSITDGKWNKFTCSTICIGSDGFYRGRDINRSGFLKPLNRARYRGN